MKLREIIGSLAQFVIKTAVFAFIVMYIFRISTAAYDYGFRVFAEEPISTDEGRTISVSIEGKQSAKDVGEMLQEKGLIRDANLFVIQELLSEGHGNIQPGIYDLNTSMTAQEMLALIAAKPEETQEDEE